MKSYFIDKTISFSDTQLKSGWAKRHFKIEGNSCVSFLGPFKSYFLYQKYKENNIRLPYFFENMLHFVIEQKKTSLKEIEYSKRLFVSKLCEHLGEGFKRLDDLIYYFEDQVCITKTLCNQRASLFHIGFFISIENSKMPIIGLDHFDISPKDFAFTMMQQYCDEENAIKDIYKKLDS